MSEETAETSEAPKPSRQEQLANKTRPKVQGMAGEGRVWEIVRRITKEDDTTFTSFLGHKTSTGYLLTRVAGPEPTTKIPEGQTPEAILVGHGLFKKYFLEDAAEVGASISNPEFLKVRKAKAESPAETESPTETETPDEDETFTVSL